MFERRTTNTQLCIGGPLDGKLLAYPDKRYRMALVGPAPPEIPSEQEIRPVEIKAMWYVRAMLSSDKGRFIFWRPEEQSVHETMERLFRGYKPAAQVGEDRPPIPPLPALASKRPKDMTAAELAALPVLRPWEIDGPTGPHERDDILLCEDRAGEMWRFIQRADGSWAKARQARTE